MGCADHIVVATPDLAAKAGDRSVSALTKMPWLFDLGYPEAEAWLRAQGVDPNDVDHRDLPTQSMMLSALRAGGGIGIVNRVVAHNDLRNGALQVLFDGINDGRGYYLVRHNGTQHTGAQVFRRWILSESKDT